MSAEQERPPDGGVDLGGALKAAAPPPRRPVDPAAVLQRGRVLRRRRTAARAALSLVLVLPLAGVLVSLARTPAIELAEGGGSIPATLPATEEPPVALVDGSAPPDLPSAVRARFDQPVVGTARLAALPEGLTADCTAPPAGSAGSPGLRQQRLIEVAGAPVVHVGPAMVASLQVGEAPAPPPFPDRYAVTCVGAPDATSASGGLVGHGPALTHLYAGWTGLDAGETAPATLRWISAVEVPDGAAWAVQEQHGWWLAYDVDAAPWLLVQTAEAVPDGAGPAEVGFPGARVVFLDAGGRTMAEERIGTDAIRADAPFLRSQATGARIRMGEEGALRAALVDGPVPVCADERAVCVWVSLDGAEIVALSAASPLPAEVPPFGFVGWCPSEGVFAESSAGSRFARDGTWARGPAPTDLHRYGVVVEDGEVTIDLGRFSFGDDRPPSAAAGGGTCADLQPPGFPAP
jgi:hypothetical protein